MSEIGCIFLSFLACGAAQQTPQEPVFTCAAIPHISRADGSSRLEQLLTSERFQNASTAQQSALAESNAVLAH
jgi:hypothetical protein